MCVITECSGLCKQSVSLNPYLDDLLMLWTGHSLGVVAVATHPGGTIAASTTLDSFVCVWEVESNATVTTLETPPLKAWLM